MLMSKSRLEKFLYALYSLDSSDLPNPLSRIEELYSCLVTGEEAPTFEPLSRVEKYLMAILGAYDVDSLPNPLSRVEVLLYKLATGDDNLDDVKSFLSEHEELLAEIIRDGGVVGDIDIEYVLYTLSTESITLYNTAKKPVKSAILKGNTKYRDIDTGDILDTFDETKNLELVSVKMPVLTTTGKNLCDGILARGYIGDSTGTVTSSSDSKHKHTPSYIKIDAAKSYYIYAEADTYMGVVKAYYYDNAKNYLGFSHELSSGDTTTVYSAFSPKYNNTHYVRFRFFKPDSSSFTSVDTKYIALYESSTSIPAYEPYKSTTVTCNEEVELRGIGEVKDELNLLTGELTRRIDESGNILSQEITESIDLSVVNQDGNDTKLKTFNDITHVTLSSEGLIPEAELEVAEKVTEVAASTRDSQIL